MDKDPLEMLLDPDNCDNIVLYDDDDEEVTFEQIAVIPIGKTIYCILRPVDGIDGLQDNEALVLSLDPGDDESFEMTVVDDDNIINQVFDEYEKLLDETE